MGERFDGEVLKYDIGFWIFSRIGEGVTSFQSLGGERYLAYHEGKTLGLVKWITHHRRDTHRAFMGTINDGRRLIPLRFEEEVILGDTPRKRITRYDYGARKVVIETEKEGKTTREEVEIPLGTLYDDPMTAFYNFRFGVYGKVEPGKEFFLETVPREGKRNVIRLIVAPREELERRRASEKKPGGKDLFIKVYLAKDLVGSLHGEVDTWFSKEIVPMAGVAKDVFFFGDIKGRLTYQGLSQTPVRANPRGKIGTTNSGMGNGAMGEGRGDVEPF